MGVQLSRFFQAYETASIFSQRQAELSEKLSISPGLPAPNPTTSYWSDPSSPLAQHGANDPLLEYADIVIIGSGITGAAIARTILDNYGPNPSKPLTVVMLEARDICSGATTRNGGHITPWLYHDYLLMKKTYGKEMAQKIIRFRLSHAVNLVKVAKDDGIHIDSQCRNVDTYDVFFDKGLFEESKAKLAIYCAEFPKESKSYRVIEDRKEIESLQLSPLVVGCISTTAGAVHPYRLVTGVLSRLLRQYSTNFHIFTHTPCTSIEKHLPKSSNSTSISHPYIVQTSRGSIQARHVVHAANGWTSHLIPEDHPSKGRMTAQRPGLNLGKAINPESGEEEADWTGSRSFVFYPGTTSERYDYLTQQLPSVSATAGDARRHLKSSGELMFGGGFAQGGMSSRSFFEAIGNSDDTTWNFSIVSYLGGALGMYFEPGWGRERSDDREDGKWFQGRVKAHWSGILGFSVDEQPWVGRVPERICKRTSLAKLDVMHNDEEKLSDSDSELSWSMMEKTSLASPASELAPSGEWISAGYTGEGMPHAWMCGTALGHMILRSRKPPPLLPGGNDASNAGSRMTSKGAPEWLPDVFLITEDRWKKASADEWLKSV